MSGRRRTRWIFEELWHERQKLLVVLAVPRLVELHLLEQLILLDKWQNLHTPAQPSAKLCLGQGFEDVVVIVHGQGKLLKVVNADGLLWRREQGLFLRDDLLSTEVQLKKWPKLIHIRAHLVQAHAELDRHLDG